MDQTANRNRVIALVRQGKKLVMLEVKAIEWQFITNGEGIGNGRKKKDVEQAFFVDVDDIVLMQWKKPVSQEILL